MDHKLMTGKIKDWIFKGLSGCVLQHFSGQNVVVYCKLFIYKY